jgi:CDP-diacylglycerol--serine O-phosphatidyltransferase
VGTVAYLAALPLGLQAYRTYERKDAEAAAAAVATETHADFAPPTAPANDERPARLN